MKLAAASPGLQVSVAQRATLQRTRSHCCSAAACADFERAVGAPTTQAGQAQQPFQLVTTHSSSRVHASPTERAMGREGGATDGGATEGGATEGGATEGGATEGGATDGGATEGGATEGGATEGGATDGGATLGGATLGGAVT